MKCIILRGVPGSGKSTWIRQNAPDAIICSADHYFERDGEYRFDGTKLGDAHRDCFQKFLNCTLARKPLLVVDNTNISAVEIAPYYTLAASQGYEVEIQLVECDPVLPALLGPQAGVTPYMEMKMKVKTKGTYLKPDGKLYRDCPTCGLTLEVNGGFGWREPNKLGWLIVQSWCIACRVDAAARARAT